MNAELSETMRAWLLGFGMQTTELLAHRKLLAQSTAHITIY